MVFISLEFWKCRIDLEEGVYFFDLSYAGVELKIASSRRNIPIHSKLIDKGILEVLKKKQKRANIKIDKVSEVLGHSYKQYNY